MGKCVVAWVNVHVPTFFFGGLGIPNLQMWHGFENVFVVARSS
jgi:hypothetical protein